LTLTHSLELIFNLSTITETVSLADRMNGIMLNDLLPTFRDAIIITRAIGFRYLWIDFLCIIQDSVPAKEAEIAKIGNTRGNAILNIVNRVQNSQGDILVPRNRPRYLPCYIGGEDNMFLAWLGTESYCDPRGVVVERYPDAWKYSLPS
jgi:hypothetical protein